MFRGGPVDHPRYAGERVFGTGINLTHLYYGRIDFLFYLVRDLGYVNKIYRGLRERTGEAVDRDRAAVRDRRPLPATARRRPRARGARLAAVPAGAQGGDHPGASNLRLPRFVGDRAARQAILSGREWVAGEPDAACCATRSSRPTSLKPRCRRGSRR